MSRRPLILPDKSANARRIARSRHQAAASGLVRVEAKVPLVARALFREVARRLAADGGEAFRQTLEALIDRRTQAAIPPVDHGAPSHTAPRDKDKPASAPTTASPASGAGPATAPTPSRVQMPTQAQIAYATRIAERIGIAVPAGASRAELSAWIARHQGRR